MKALSSKPRQADMETIPDVSPAQRAASDLVKILRKLRWMGIEGESEWMEVQSELNRLRPGDSILAQPRDTD